MKINREKDDMGKFALACMIGFILASFFLKACELRINDYIDSIKNQL